MKLIIPSALAAALVSTANGQEGCGQWTASSASTTRGTNIVNEIWEASGKDCGYADRQFEGDVKRALDAEFPNNCDDNGVVSAFVDRVVSHHLSLDTNAAHPILNSSTPTEMAYRLA